MAISSLHAGVISATFDAGDTATNPTISPSAALRKQLHRVAPAKARALRSVFGKDDALVLEGDPTTTWRFHLAHPVSPHGVLLHGVTEELSLNLSEDGLSQRLGDCEWWDYDGDSRLLAWTLAHSVLLEALGKLLHEPLMPHAWSETSPALSDPSLTVTLGFTTTTPDGRTTSGLLRMSPSAVTHLVAHPGWQPSQPVIPDAWKALPVKLRIEMHGTGFPVREILAAEVGDVLVLGNRAHCWRNLQVSSEESLDVKQRWSAAYDGGRLRITAALPHLSTESFMSEAPANANNSVSDSGMLASVGVTVDFELGSASLPLGDLAKLKPGYVFELAGYLDQIRVVIRANGARVGYGELVTVGDTLGVQLLSIETNGLR